MAILGSTGKEWKRDRSVQEMIDYLDHPDHNSFDKLKAKECAYIVEEINKCREDFSYAARNYFWLATKDAQRVLFKLWEGQEIILDRLNWLKSRNTAQKLLIIKARQLGCSTLIEALIAWRTIYFSNINSMIVSYDEKHTAYLLKMVWHFLDNLPWWMKPMSSSRKIREHLELDNPDAEARRSNPGLNSTLRCTWANTMTEVGRGMALQAVHVSEFARFPEERAQKIIKEDLHTAIPRNPEAFAILESTAKGAGTYSHELWRTNMRLAERADWYPLFLPWFFEKTRVESPPQGWHIAKPELEMKETASRDWIKCDSPDCGRPAQRHEIGKDRAGLPCPFCNVGTSHPYELTDRQLRYMETERLNCGNDPEDAKKLKQEVASTAEEAFQVSGKPLLSGDVYSYLNRTLQEPLARGYLDNEGTFHGVNPNTSHCFVAACAIDHTYDDNLLIVYEWPKPGETYQIGADVAGGVYEDSSVCQVIRIGRGTTPDKQVASWGSNSINPIDFGHILNRVGRFYNEAQIAVEINRYDTALGTLMDRCNYPNIYARPSAVKNFPTPSQFGWNTNVKSKPRLWVTLKKWLESENFIVTDRETAEQMKTFRPDPDDKKRLKRAYSFHDDYVMAIMIALYTAHEGEWDDMMDTIHIQRVLTLKNAPWIMNCSRCDHNWPATTPAEFSKCPECRSMHISGKQNTNESQGVSVQLPETYYDSPSSSLSYISSFEEL